MSEPRKPKQPDGISEDQWRLMLLVEGWCSICATKLHEVARGTRSAAGRHYQCDEGYTWTDASIAREIASLRETVELQEKRVIEEAEMPW